MIGLGERFVEVARNELACLRGDSFLARLGADRRQADDALDAAAVDVDDHLECEVHLALSDEVVEALEPRLEHKAHHLGLGAEHEERAGVLLKRLIARILARVLERLGHVAASG